ncbi:hypothetical protein DOY81_005326 [Sarcophaga bullata]|nr:hypothetical protein DOY81_005326 [Sarcophaga bullata]
MFKILFFVVLIAILTEWCCTFTVQPLEFELFDDKFRLSIPDDPDLKWVSFHVNINKEFRSFEAGQLTGIASLPRNKKWSYEFERKLKDNDIVYIWLAVQHNHLIFRDKKDPISVEAFKSGNPVYTISTSSPVIDKVTDKPVTNPINIDKENKICHPTISEVSRGGPYCKNDLLFGDEFEIFNPQYWVNEVRIPPTIDDAEFVLYNGTARVDNGILRIDASKNILNLKRDSIDLGLRCTSLKVLTECSLEPQGVLILPPVVSGRVNTRKYFSFKYGRIEIRARLPIGDWLFPLISLEPYTPEYGDHYRSGEMRIAYTRGNINLKWQNKNIDGGRLFGGALLNEKFDLRHQFMKDTTLPNVDHFGNQFHTYSLTWLPDELILAVDGNEYGRIPTNFKEQITESFYITLGLSAGGNGDFPDTPEKPWRNTNPRGSWTFSKDKTWLPTWSQPTLEVDYVRVYAV